VIRTDPPPAELMTLANEDLRVLEGLQDPNPVEEEFLLELPKIVDLTKKIRKKYLIQELKLNASNNEKHRPSLCAQFPLWLNGIETLIIGVANPESYAHMIGRF